MGKSGHIVVVEDAPAIAEVLQGFFGVAGYSVDWAPDGAAAFDLIETTPPDAVVTDVLMPNLSGTDLLRRLRASPRHCRLPVVLFTGLPRDNEDIAEAISLPLVRMVQKGKPFREVVAAVAELRQEAAQSLIHTTVS